MFDIGFYMNIYPILQRLADGEIIDKETVFNEFERCRNSEPVIYNIETTNACNMKCRMCPRTTKMTRPITTMGQESFVRIIDQLRPHSKSNWEKWEKFVSEHYGIQSTDMSENHFFLYIIPKVIQLHGYGDPLLDRNIHENVRLLNERGFQSYFSCNPSNIDMNKTIKMLEYGLDYIKYSIESVDDEVFKGIRGNESNFSKSYKNILELLNLKEKKGHKTIFVITMLDLNRNQQQEEFHKLLETFKNLDVYIYLKSEDQQWYRKDFHGTKSIHWSEVCKHPWMSMTIKSNCEVVMCMEDYNNEIVLGNIDKNTLYDIWNGPEYTKFRKDHFLKTPKIKCTEECDMSVIGNYLKK
jgi:radical SAM protein with 4Fe4S-binding SPASM domain